MSKTVLFQTIQLSMQKQFNLKQFSLAYVHSLNIKTILFQTIQFSISMQFSSIWPIDRTLSGATTPGQSGLGVMSVKRYSAFPKAPALLEPHHQIVNVIFRTLNGWRSYPSVEMQSVYSTAPAWAMYIYRICLFIHYLD